MFVEITIALVITGVALLMDLRYSKEISPIISFVIVLIGVVLDRQHIVIIGMLFLVMYRFIVLSIYTIKIYRGLMAFLEIFKEPLLLFLLVIISGVVSANVLIPGLDKWSSSIIFLLIMLLATRNVASASIDDLSFIGDMLLKDLHSVINGIDRLSDILIVITCLVTIVIWRLIGLLIITSYLITAFASSKIHIKKYYVKNMIKLIPTLTGFLIGFIY